MITCLEWGGVAETMAFWSVIFGWLPGAQEAGYFAQKPPGRRVKKASCLLLFDHYNIFSPQNLISNLYLFISFFNLKH
jgi:hypothetical protein